MRRLRQNEIHRGVPRVRGAMVAGLLFLLCLTGCGPGDEERGVAETDAEAPLTVRLTRDNIAVEAPAEELTLQGPRGFITPEFLKVVERELREETGQDITLEAAGYDDDLDLMSALQGRTGGGLVLAPRRSLEEIRQMGLVQPLRGTSGGGDLYDPYLFAALGVLTREPLPATVAWENVFQQENAEDIYWLCRPEDVVAAAFLATKHSPNQLDPEVITQVTQLLRNTPALGKFAGQKPSVLTPGELIGARPNLRVVTYSHLARGLMGTDSALHFAVPREGSPKFELGWIIPRHAPSRLTAERVLRVLRRPPVVAEFARQTGMTPAQAEEAAHLPRRQDAGNAAVTLPIGRTYYDTSPYRMVRSDRLQPLEEIVVERGGNFTERGVVEDDDHDHDHDHEQDQDQDQDQDQEQEQDQDHDQDHDQDQDLDQDQDHELEHEHEGARNLESGEELGLDAEGDQAGVDTEEILDSVLQTLDRLESKGS